MKCLAKYLYLPLLAFLLSHQCLAQTKPAGKEPRALARIVSISNDTIAPCEIVFRNHSTYADTYEWDFGDPASGERNFSQEENPSHRFGSAGFYTIRMIVRNSTLQLEESWYYSILIREGKTADQSITLTAPLAEESAVEVLPVSLSSGEQKHKTLKLAWMGGTLISAGTGILASLKSNGYYEEYQTATQEAEDIRRKFKTLDTLAPAAYVLSGICLSQVVLQSARQKKARQELSLQLMPMSNGNKLCLTWKF